MCTCGFSKMEAKRKFNIFVGAETGLLKGIDVEKRGWANINSITAPDKQNEVTAMCWGDKEQTQVCLALRKRTVLEYDVRSESMMENTGLVDGDGVFRGIAVHNGRYITCTDKGVLRVSAEEDSQAVEINAGPSVRRMRQSPTNSHLVVTGGDENPLKLWDLNTASAEPIFKAKNVRPDTLNLRIPVCDLDMGFFPDNNNIVSSTAHHQVRVYDPGCSQRRPVFEMEYDDLPISALAVVPGTRQVIVGNTYSNMATLDLRMKGMVVNKFKGLSGAVRGLHCHASQPLVASCGLDRFLRIHDRNTRKLQYKFYLKSRLNCLLMSDSWPTDKQTDKLDKDKKECEAEEDEDVWEDMEEAEVAAPGGGKRKHEEDDGDSAQEEEAEKPTSKSKKMKKKKKPRTK